MRLRRAMAWGAIICLALLSALGSMSRPTRGAEIDTAEAQQLSPDVLGDALAYARQQDDYAGAFFDIAHQSEPVFLFANDGSDRRDALKQRLPDGTVFDVRQAQLTYAQLVKLRDQVVASEASLAAEGIVLTGVALHEVTNKVQIGIDGLTDEQANVLFAQFGPSIEPEAEGVAFADSCNDITDCWPMKSGLGIWAGNHSAKCTSGYLGRLTQATGQPVVVVTAGHCIYQSDALNWWEGDLLNKIGNERDYTFQPTEGVHINADVGLIGYQDAANGQPFNQILYKNTPLLGNVTGYVAAQDQMDNTYICRMGYGSLTRPGYTAKTCGLIINTGASKKSCANRPGTSTEVCNWVDNETVVDFDSTGGDSGGPYYRNPDKPGFDPNHVFLFGIHTHSADDYTCDHDASTCKGWFSTVDWARAALLVQFGTSDQLDICLNAACTIP